MSRWFSVVLAAFVFSTIAFGQGEFGESMPPLSFDVVTVEMPADLASSLQRRIAEGGAAASAAVEKLPDLVKSGKVRERDRWHQRTNSGTLSKHAFPSSAARPGKEKEESPLGFRIGLEPIVSDASRVDVRYTLDSGEKIKSDASNLRTWSANAALTVKSEEWCCLGMRQEGDQALLVIAKFTPLEDKSKEPTDTAIRNAYIGYKICLLEGTPPIEDAKGRITGDAARELLSKVKILQAGGQQVRLGQQWAHASGSYPVGGISGGTPDQIYLDGCMAVSADQKISVMAVSFEGNLSLKGGKAVKAGYKGWVELPVGEPSFLPLVQDERAKGGRLLLVITPEVRVMRPAAEQGLIVHPGARKLLAQAAGLSIPTPTRIKCDFDALPTIVESLSNLGLRLPKDATGDMDFERSALWIAPAVDAKKLGAILSQYLPQPISK